jgi:putative DNA primase/helicase
MNAPAAVYGAMYTELKLALTWTWPGSKGPRHHGWQLSSKSITSPAAARRYWTDHPEHGIAVLLSPSRLVSLDIDDVERSTLVLAHFGIDLDGLRSVTPCIVGRHFRLLFRAPAVGLKHRTLAWPRRDRRPGGDVVFELRAGPISDTLPPTIHPGTGKPYGWQNAPLHGFPALPATILTLWEDWDNTQRVARALCPWAPPPAPPRPAPLRPAGPCWAAPRQSIIDAFNAAHDIGVILEAHGYTPKGRRYTAPDSQHAAGISVLDDGRVYCHHLGDALADGHAHDAFDVYRILAHAGDYRLAVKAAAVALGLNRYVTA